MRTTWIAALVMVTPCLAFARGTPESFRDSRDRLERAADLIEQEQYNESVDQIAGAVEIEEEQLEEAEKLFARIREALTRWNEKGDEVRQVISRLLEPDFPDEEVLPTAVEALALIQEMREIYPNPSAEQAALIGQMNEQVSLTVDRRRFRAVMDAAAERLEEGDYTGAVEIYVAGLEQEFENLTEAQAALVNDESGLNLQRTTFESNPQDVGDQLVASAREEVRRIALEDDQSFVAVAPEAQEQARQMSEAFASGDFTSVETLLEDYLPQLRTVFAFYQDVQDNAEVLAAQETLNAARLMEDDEYKYDWHTRFVSDLVLGRRSGEEAREDEGILYAMNQVRRIVADSPVEATQQYAQSTYDQAVEALLAFPWAEYTSPSDDPLVTAHREELLALIDAAQSAAITTIEIINVADELDIDVPSVNAVLAGGDPAPQAYAAVYATAADLPDEVRQTFLDSATTRLVSSIQLQETLLAAVNAWDESTPLASQNELEPLVAQRARVKEPLTLIQERLDAWSSLPPSLRDEYAPAHVGYLEGRIDALERAELEIVATAANIEVDSLEERLSELVASVAEADEALAREEALTGGIDAPRPLSGRARDVLLPLVGTVEQQTVVNVEDGLLVGLREDADGTATRLLAEEPYIVPDTRVQAEIATAQEIAATVGTENVGLLSRAEELLEQALTQVAVAEEAESEGRSQIVRIEQVVRNAETASTQGEITRASELLAEAKQLYDSDDPTVADAGDLFEVSLENWYRPDVESFWNDELVRLNDVILAAEKTVVFNQVDSLTGIAQPLIRDREFADALDVLENAEQIWNNVFPTQPNPTLAALLRQARTGFSQESARVLREDLPGYTRLSQILNTAYGAFDARSYETAEQALELFFTEQPLNFDARLLEVRLALANADDEPDEVVADLVESALEEADATRAELRSRVIGNNSFGALLELESKLQAVLEVIEDEESVSQDARNEVLTILDQVDAIIRPPAVLPAPPPNLRAEADRLIAEAEAYGDWARLPREQLIEVLNLLTQAIETLPGYEPAISRYQLALTSPNAPTRQPLPPAGRAVLEQASSLVAQGQIDEARSVMEAYLETNPNARLDQNFRTLYDELRRIQLGG
ncbi:MAG: hypothetical protein ACLFP4_00610 [Spirochaetales bacterium]